MEEAEHIRSSEGSRVSLTPDMRPVSDSKHEPAAPPAPSKSTPRRPIWALVFGALGLVSGLAGLGAAAWVYAEGQAETRRLASEVAQLRISLDLYARGNGQNTAPDNGGLTELANRLTTLEQNINNPATPMPATGMAAPANASNEDCLPPGMRILVAEGDSYPVCGQSSVVNVSQVANGYVVLLDGTTIASGGSILLAGGPCTIGVTSGGDEGLTGYAEIRVTC